MPSPGPPESTSGSIPYRSRQTSASPKNSYKDASVQTDVVENAWYSRPATPLRKKSIIPLSKRLLNNRVKIQKETEARRNLAGRDNQSVQTSPTVSMDLDGPAHEEQSNPESPTESRGRNRSIMSSSPSADVSATTVDVNVTDAPAIMVGNTIKPPPPPWPGHSNVVPRSNFISKLKSPDLRVQMLPTPSFTTLRYVWNHFRQRHSIFGSYIDSTVSIWNAFAEPLLANDC